MESEGDESPDLAAGHLSFTVVTLPDPVFRRENDDLHMEVKIPLAKALLGVDMEITHLDGHKVAIKKPGITRPEEVFMIRDEGMPKYGMSSSRGHLYCRFEIVFPDKLSDSQKESLKAILV